MKKKGLQFSITSIAVMLIGVFMQLHVSGKDAGLPLSKGMLYRKLQGTRTHKQFPDNCYKVVTDECGYLWVSTQRGLFFFNGQDFEKFDIDCTNEDFIYAVRDGRFLIVWNYLGEIFRIDTRTHRHAGVETRSSWNRQAHLYNYYLHVRDSIYLIRFSGISVAFADTQFLSLNTQVAARTFDQPDKRCSELLKQQYQILSPESALIDSGFRNQRLNLWMNESDFCLDRYIFKKEGSQCMPIFRIPGPGNSIFAYLIRGRELWINRSDGRFLYYPDYRFPEKDSALIATDIRGVNMCADAAGNIYLSTLEEGVLWIPHKMTRTTYYPLYNNPAPFAPDVRFIYKDTTQLFVGYRMPVVDIFHQDASRTRKSLPDSGKPDPVRLFYTRSDGSACMVTTHTIAQFPATATQIRYPLGVTPFTVKDAYARDGIAYVTIKSGRYFIDTFGNRPQSSYRIGQIPKYALSFAPTDKNRNFIIGKAPLQDKLDEPSSVKNLLASKIRNFDGEIVILTASGLYCTNTDRGEKPIHILKKPEIIDILWDGGDQYFILSPYELTQMSRTTKKSRTILSQNDLSEGLRFNTVHLSDSVLYLGCNKGILKLSPCDRDDTCPQLHKFRIINRDSTGSHYFANQTTCSWKKNIELKFKFDIPITHNPGEALWMLLDEDSAVMARGSVNNGSCSFVPTSPGSYKMCILHTDASGIQRIAAEYQINILPCWWQTNIAKGLLSLAGIGLIAFACYYYARHLQEKRYRRLRQRHNYLVVKNKLYLSRLKPHFIFNAFNPLQKYIIYNQKNEALHYISEFSALMRNAMRIFDKDYITLESELEFLHQYISIQKERFDSAFDFRVFVSEAISVGQTFIPPMILQPIIENSVEYGVPLWTMERKGTITLRIQAGSNAKSIEITIEDNGPGYPMGFEPINGHGLYLIVERIQLIQSSTGTGSILFTNNESGAFTKIILPHIISPTPQHYDGKI